MVHNSDSDGEDEKEKKADKRVPSKALPQEQAAIRFKYRGTQDPLELKSDKSQTSDLICVYHKPISLSSSS